MTENLNAIAKFWEMFREHSEELSALSTANHPVYDLILKHLQLIHPKIYFEFSSDPISAELIITAEGNPALFPLVEFIVANAPEIPGWSIRALKPKLGFPVKTTWEGVTINIAEVVFDPLEREGSDDLGLLIFVPELSSDDIEAAHNAILRALDHALGEKQFAESVQYTEAIPLRDAASAADYIPLKELEKYINWRKKKRGKDTGGQGSLVD